MTMIRDWKPRHWISALAALLFVMALLAIIIGLLLTRPASIEVGAAGGNGASASGDLSPTADANTSESGEEPFSVDESDYPELDSAGYATMAVTNDPREAAASAAALLWSGDFGVGKIEFAEDFQAEAAERTGHPDPSYMGPGELRTWIPVGEGSVLEAPERVFADPVETMATIAMPPVRPDGWWYAHADDATVGALISRNAKVLSKPITVLDADEVLKLDPTVSAEIGDEAQPSREGVTAHKFWVRVETSTFMGDEVAKSRNAAAMVVYCDPPEDGGLCGVGVLTKSYPDQWRNQY